MTIQSAQKRLVAVVQKLVAKKEKREVLEQLKKNEKDFARNDFIWHYLLSSFATMGRESGWNGLIGDQNNYRQVIFKSLVALSPEARNERVHSVCREAGIRWHKMKAKFILGCFDCVQKLGGPEKAKEKLIAQKGKEAKIQFLKTFPGIGEKYARNIMMDVYHEEFRDSIAIDVRIKAISKALGLKFNYRDEESFYLTVAHQAGLNGWELDRLLFKFRKEVEEKLV